MVISSHHDTDSFVTMNLRHRFYSSENTTSATTQLAAALPARSRGVSRYHVFVTQTYRRSVADALYTEQDHIRKPPELDKRLVTDVEMRRQ